MQTILSFRRLSFQKNKNSTPNENPTKNNSLFALHKYLYYFRLLGLYFLYLLTILQKDVTE